MVRFFIFATFAFLTWAIVITILYARESEGANSLIETIDKVKQDEKVEKESKWVYKADADLPRLIRMMLEVIELLDELKIRYFVGFGTLLALVRDGKIFDWDHDVDLCVHWEDLGKIREQLLPMLAERNIEVSLDYATESMDAVMSTSSFSMLKLLGYHGTYIDLHTVPYVPHLNTMKWFGGKPGTPWASEVHVKIPMDVDAYLSMMYGPDWRVPKRGKHGQPHELLPDTEYAKVYNDVLDRPSGVIECDEVNGRIV